ncbi:MAG TPA: hypothetical protein VLC79_08910 [Cellvibrio sp.]|nr:hypothetical protein [Cellvibrio sp.]
MSVVIAYQSLNSNVSHEHDVEAATSQMHTRKAQKTLAEKTSERISLKFPVAADGKDPDVGVYGPAELLPTAPADFMDKGKRGKKRKADEMEADDASIRMLGMFHGKALQIYQLAHREFGQACNLLTFGELDARHKSWVDAELAAGKLVHASVFPKACNCFSLHSANSAHNTQFIAEGDGWVAALCNGVRVVFVHVPNELATDATKVTAFYQKIKTTVLKSVGTGGGVIDVVMGDTNQPNAMFSPTNVSAGLDTKFSDGHPDKKIAPVDTHAVTFKGTNSVETKKFDVALYNVATVKKLEVRYFSQFSHVAKIAAAYTDHMGVMVRVEKK